MAKNRQQVIVNIVEIDANTFDLNITFFPSILQGKAFDGLSDTQKKMQHIAAELAQSFTKTIQTNDFNRVKNGN